MSCSTILKAKGYKLTPQRRLVVEYFHEHDAHLTADEIIRFIEERAPGVDKSTVYRTLDLLENIGCIVKSEVDGHFIYHHAEEGHHHHLRCRSCGTTIECKEDLFDDIAHILMEEYGFQPDFKHMVIQGLCDECKQKQR